MSRRVGQRDRFPCVTNEITTNPDYYCNGSMNGTYGSECNKECRCSGSVTVTQYMNCSYDRCGSYVAEVFEYCCRECGEYGIGKLMTNRYSNARF